MAEEFTSKVHASIGYKIRKVREYVNMTQSEMSKRLGISRVSLSNIENEVQSINVDTITKIIDIIKDKCPYINYEYFFDKREHNILCLSDELSHSLGFCDKAIENIYKIINYNPNLYSYDIEFLNDISRPYFKLLNIFLANESLLKFLITLDDLTADNAKFRKEFLDEDNREFMYWRVENALKDLSKSLLKDIFKAYNDNHGDIVKELNI